MESKVSIIEVTKSELEEITKIKHTEYDDKKPNLPFCPKQKEVVDETEKDINEEEIIEVDNLEKNNGDKIPPINFSGINDFLKFTSLFANRVANLAENIQTDINENPKINLNSTKINSALKNIFLPQQAEIQNFFAECLEEGSIEEAIILTKENFNLSDDYKITVNLEITFAENAVIRVKK